MYVRIYRINVRANKIKKKYLNGRDRSRGHQLCIK